MKALLMLFLVFYTSTIYANNIPDINSFSQQQIFINWVQNRCISKITDSRTLKDDASASAAAWFEASDMPADVFEEADKTIDSLLKEDIGGTARVRYQVLKCSLITNSDAILQLTR